MSVEEMWETVVELEKYCWRGKWDGVRFEVVKWGYGDTDPYPPTWNYYLSVHEGQVPPTNWPRYWLDANEPNKFGRVYYPLHKTFLYDLYWPGGAECSYYQKHVGEQAHGSMAGNTVQFGCAYSDEGWKPAVIDDALEDVKYTIESLRQVEPDLKYICNYCGGFFHGHEGRGLGSGWYCDEHHLGVSMAREGIGDVD